MVVGLISCTQGIRYGLPSDYTVALQLRLYLAQGLHGLTFFSTISSSLYKSEEIEM